MMTRTPTRQPLPEQATASKVNGHPLPAVKRRKSVLIPGTHQTEGGETIEQGNDVFTDDVLNGLPPATIYRRAGAAGLVIGEAGEKSFSALPVDSTRIILDEHFRMTKWIQRGKGENAAQVCVYIPTNRDNAGLVLARAGADSRIAEIKSLTSYPIFLRNFQLSKAGFHEGVFYDEPPALRDLIPILDRGDIHATLDDLLIDFPFKTEADRQNYIAFMLTPFIRIAIDGNAPGHLVQSSLERTGKTKLVEVAGYIATGKQTPAMQIAETNEEMDKRIMTMLRAGRTILHLDNLKEWVDLPSLASLFTARVYQGRRLGHLEIIESPNNMTIAASGNNVRASGELVKRMVPIWLQPQSDSPETRTDFQHADLWTYAASVRRQVLECLLGWCCYG